MFSRFSTLILLGTLSVAILTACSDKTELQNPLITQINPLEATTGEVIEINGTNFGDNINQTTVKFGQTIAVKTQISRTGIMVKVPSLSEGIQSVTVEVGQPPRVSNTVSFKVKAGSTTTTTQPSADQIAPTIMSSSPTGTSVSKLVSQISIAFSEPMDTSIAANVISFLQPLTGAPTISNPSWSIDSRTLSVAVGALTTSTTYRFTVANTVKDLAGNKLAAAAEFQFATASDVVSSAGGCTPNSFSGPNLIKNPDFSSPIAAGLIIQPTTTPVPTSSSAAPTTFGDFAAQMRYDGISVYPDQPGGVNSFSIFNGKFLDTDPAPRGRGSAFNGSQEPFPGDPTYGVAATPYWMYVDGNALGQKQVDAWLVSQGRNPGVPADAYRPYPPPGGKNDPLPLPAPFNVAADRTYTVWEQEVTGLKASGTYEFSYYVSNVIEKLVRGGIVEVSAYADPEISVVVNGTEVTPPTRVLKANFRDASNKFGWERRCTALKADASGKLKLQLRNGAPGNDGDDLALTQLSLKN
jgi:Bacterial Ig-like domain